MKLWLTITTLSLISVGVVVWQFELLSGYSASTARSQKTMVIAEGFDFPVGDPDARGVASHNGSLECRRWGKSIGFGKMYRFGIHPGEDWNGGGGGCRTDLGQPVFAIAAGEVTFADNCEEDLGNVVTVDHQFNGPVRQQTVQSVYAHLQTMYVEQGEIVERRQLIGTIGQDPDQNYAPHLHFELRSNIHLPPDFWPSDEGKDLAWVKNNYLDPTTFIRSHR